MTDFIGYIGHIGEDCEKFIFTDADHLVAWLEEPVEEGAIKVPYVSGPVPYLGNERNFEVLRNYGC